MKKRFSILVVVALVAAACSSAESTTNTGLTRSTSPEIPTTTSAPPTTAGGGDSTPGTSDGGSLPTNPDESEVTVPLEVEPCIPPEESLAAYCQPFELVLGNTTIIWDRWFWGQGTFSKGTVEVYHGDTLVAAGPFVGEGSIVEQGDDNSFIFYDADGMVVAVAKPEEITPAIEAVLAELNG